MNVVFYLRKKNFLDKLRITITHMIYSEMQDVDQMFFISTESSLWGNIFWITAEKIKNTAEYFQEALLRGKVVIKLEIIDSKENVFVSLSHMNNTKIT